MPGMRTSMITTSGLRRSTSATALLAVGRLADHADVRRAREREPEPLADDLVVVDDQARDLLRHAPIIERPAADARSASQTASASCSRRRRGLAACTRPAVADAVPSPRARRPSARTGSACAFGR